MAACIGCIVITVASVRSAGVDPLISMSFDGNDAADAEDKCAEDTADDGPCDYGSGWLVSVTVSPVGRGTVAITARRFCRNRRGWSDTGSGPVWLRHICYCRSDLSRKGARRVARLCGSGRRRGRRRSYQRRSSGVRGRRLIGRCRCGFWVGNHNQVGRLVRVKPGIVAGRVDRQSRRDRRVSTIPCRFATDQLRRFERLFRRGQSAPKASKMVSPTAAAEWPQTA